LSLGSEEVVAKKCRPFMITIS
jgi:hypothetical protein